MASALLRRRAASRGRSYFSIVSVLYTNNQDNYYLNRHHSGKVAIQPFFNLTNEFHFLISYTRHFSLDQNLNFTL